MALIIRAEHLLGIPGFGARPVPPKHTSSRRAGGLRTSSAHERQCTLGPRRRQSVPPEALAGGGSGSISGGGKDWGSGGGGSGGGGGADDSSASDAAGPGWMQGWRERVAYDPEFPFKVFLEQVIGVGASVIGDMSSRPNWGMNELDFVFATVVVGSIMNFSLMYLLAPTASAAAGAAAAPLMSRLLAGDVLLSVGAPKGNMFEAGYPVSKRLANFVYKGAVFACIGFLAGLVGTCTSNTLLTIRKKLDPSFVTQNEAPPVLLNSACWSIQMGLSANLRYQVLGGTDRVLMTMMPNGVFRIYSAAIRAANNVVGGMSFVTIARMFGAQKAGTKEALAP